MRADRASAYQQWGLGEVAALDREHHLGKHVLREAAKGAAKFAAGAGRGGSFSAFKPPPGHSNSQKGTTDRAKL